MLMLCNRGGSRRLWWVGSDCRFQHTPYVARSSSTPAWARVRGQAFLIERTRLCGGHLSVTVWEAIRQTAFPSSEGRCSLNWKPTVSQIHVAAGENKFWSCVRQTGRRCTSRFVLGLNYRKRLWIYLFFEKQKRLWMVIMLLQPMLVCFGWKQCSCSPCQGSPCCFLMAFCN